MIKTIPARFVKRVEELYISECIALIHSEASESLEDARNGDMQEVIAITGKPVGFPSELADVVIRCFDLAGFLKIDLELMIQRKHNHNKNRPFKHGKKF